MQNFGNIMKQAKKIQEKMARLQEELADKTVEATAGGGMVTATVNGRFELVSIKLDKEVVNAEDVEMLQDLVTAAINEAGRKVDEAMKSSLGGMLGGLGGIL